MKSAIEQFEMIAQAQGWQVTKADKLMLQIIFSTHQHFSLRDLARHNQLKRVSYYQLRAGLKKFIHARMIRKVYMSHNKIMYEHVYGHMHHDHMICIECGQIQEFNDPRIEQQQVEVAERFNFKLLNHSMNLFGVCQRCQGKVSKHHQVLQPDLIDNQRDNKVPLSIIADGEEVRVVEIRGGCQLQKRLNELQIVPEIKIEVLNNHFAGQMMIRVGHSRIGLGHHMTHKIMVERISSKKGSHGKQSE